jgi:hypothetical protein
MAKQEAQQVDLLDYDRPIAGQKYACISFVSPETVLKKKELFFFEQFLKNWDISKSLQKFEQFINFIAFKHNLQNEVLLQDFKDFLAEEHSELQENQIDMNDDYKTFMENSEDKLTDTFQKNHQFQTSVRGLKIRGSFNTQEEAENYCKKLREHDPNHDIFVGPVGTWIPWEPDAYKTGKIEYLETELNNLMHQKKENESKAKDVFDERIKDAKRTAIEENIKKARKTGNNLTQTITKDDELVNVANISLDEALASANVRDELFNEINIQPTDRSNENKIA